MRKDLNFELETLRSDIFQHTANRPMFALVKAQKTSQAERDILMDFLRKSEEEITGKIRVHSVDLALRIENWGVVPCRTVELSTLNEEIRPIYTCLVEIIDTVADDLGHFFLFKIIYTFLGFCGRTYMKKMLRSAAQTIEKLNFKF